MNIFSAPIPERPLDPPEPFGRVIDEEVETFESLFEEATEEMGLIKSRFDAQEFGDVLDSIETLRDRLNDLEAIAKSLAED